MKRSKTYQRLSPSFVLTGIAFTILLFGCGGDDGTSQPPPKRTTGQNLTYEWNGTSRSYHFYKPDNLPANAPLVMVLHGYDQDNNFPWDHYEMNDVADAEGFAVCYPLGSPTDGDTIHWNANLTAGSVNDTQFLVDLADELQEIHDLDPNRTFSCGMSNGGFMSYTLACDAAGTFRAIASVAGTMSGATWENCDPSTPTSVLHIHGTADRVIPDDGDFESEHGFEGAPGVATVVAWWADRNSCDPADTVMFTDNTTAFYYRNGTGGNEVWYLSTMNNGHRWPGQTFEPGNDQAGYNASEVIWEFFDMFD